MPIFFLYLYRQQGKHCCLFIQISYRLFFNISQNIIDQRFLGFYLIFFEYSGNADLSTVKIFFGCLSFMIENPLVHFIEIKS